MGEIIADIVAKTIVTIIKLGIVGGLLLIKAGLSDNRIWNNLKILKSDWKILIILQILYGFIGMIIGNILAYILGYVPVTTLQKMTLAFLGGCIL